MRKAIFTAVCLMLAMPSAGLADGKVIANESSAQCDGMGGQALVACEARAGVGDVELRLRFALNQQEFERCILLDIDLGDGVGEAAVTAWPQVLLDDLGPATRTHFDEYARVLGPVCPG